MNRLLKLIKEIPRNNCLTALRAACLHIFRHLAQILLEIRRYSCVGFILADEKSDGAIHTQSLCGVALILKFFLLYNFSHHTTSSNNPNVLSVIAALIPQF